MPRRSARKKDQAKTLKIVGLVVVVLAIIAGGVWFWRVRNSDEKSGREAARIECAQGKILVNDECQEIRPEFLDLSEVVKKWGEGAQGLTSAYIYDLDNDKVAGEFYADSSHETASLYKLFVVYEGYQRLSSSVWADDPGFLTVGAETFSRTDCLDLAIRESYSVCAESLLEEMGKTELDEIVRNNWGFMGTSMVELRSTAIDIAGIMRRFYVHEGIQDKLIERMKDSFLTQPATNREKSCETICDWRQGLPAGFSDKVKVYNKVGWDETNGNWSIYNDAAIVELPDEKSGATRHYIVVAMTKGVGPEVNKGLAEAVETAVNGAKVTPEIENSVEDGVTEMGGEAGIETGTMENETESGATSTEVEQENIEVQPGVDTGDDISPESYVGEPTSE